MGCRSPTSTSDESSASHSSRLRHDHVLGASPPKCQTGNHERDDDRPAAEKHEAGNEESDTTDRPCPCGQMLLGLRVHTCLRAHGWESMAYFNSYAVTISTRPGHEHFPCLVAEHPPSYPWVTPCCPDDQAGVFNRIDFGEFPCRCSIELNALEGHGAPLPLFWGGFCCFTHVILPTYGVNVALS